MGRPPFQLVGKRKRAKARRSIGLLLSLLLIITSIATLVTLQHFQARAASSQSLPGQQVWRQGTSSLLFGANDASWQWAKYNMGNNPAIAATVRNAGITVIRSPLTAADAQARVTAIEAAGAKCLGILSPTDAEQVVQMLGDRCNMYEWMNEPDNGGPSASAYANLWNQHIPQLRSLNPKAIFIGPVVASPNLAYIQQFLSMAKQAGNIPDAISFHMYPCTDKSISGCVSKASSYSSAASQVRTTINSVLGYDLPLAITEWNYSWKPNQTPQNDPFIKTFTTNSINAMAQAGIVLATQFDIASDAGGSSLDMVDTQTGQPLPQLKAMQQAIQQYQLQTAPPKLPIATTGAGNLPPTQAPTQGPPAPNQPIAVNQPIMANQPAPIVAVGGPPGADIFVAGQQLQCEPGAPINPQVNSITQPGSNSTVISWLGITQDGCSLILKVQNPQQTLRFNWWNAGMAVTNKLTFQVSVDSTNGMDGTWQDFPATSFLAAGGTQIVTLQGQPWIRVRVAAPASNMPAVNLFMEINTLTTPASGGVINPQPIILPQN